MRRAAALLLPALRDARPRLLGLVAFGALFLAAGAASRLFLVGPEGRVEVGRLFAVGGYPLASVLLLLGWLLGRYPMIATLVLTAGLFSRDCERGYARLYLTRPVSPLALYGTRLAALLLLAVALSALFMPAFDLLMLGTWAGPATLVLITAEVLVYGGLTALLSVWTRGDAWIALFLAALALVWNAALGGGVAVPPGPRRFIGLVLPPQGALLRLESAFGAVAPIPWDAFLYAAGWGSVLLVLAGVAVRRREV